MKFEINSDRRPFLFTGPSTRKTFIIPGWIEVPADTTMEDIVWIKPETKKTEPSKPIQAGEYTIKFDTKKNHYVCNCQGFWRVKDKSIGCKHIQKLKAGITN